EHREALIADQQEFEQRYEQWQQQAGTVATDRAQADPFVTDASEAEPVSSLAAAKMAALAAMQVENAAVAPCARAPHSSAETNTDSPTTAADAHQTSAKSDNAKPHSPADNHNIPKITKDSLRAQDEKDATPEPEESPAEPPRPSILDNVDDETRERVRMLRRLKPRSTDEQLLELVQQQAHENPTANKKKKGWFSR
ncbi:MAG: hypothetical protein AB7V46_19805, partial [Thermomicrobiales bacterium]